MPAHTRLLQNVKGSAIGSFIKENPILSGVSLGAGIAGIAATTVAVSGRKKAKKRVRKRTQKRKIKRRKIIHVNSKHKIVRRRKGKAKRSRIIHKSPRHKGHKRVSFVTKDGRKVSFLSKR